MNTISANDHVRLTEAAMCLWEAYCDRGEHVCDYAREAIGYRCDDRGTPVVRHEFINILAPAVDLAAKAFRERFPDACVSFDWELCPRFLAECVDWEQSENSPLTLFDDHIERLFARIKSDGIMQ